MATNLEAYAENWAHRAARTADAAAIARIAARTLPEPWSSAAVRARLAQPVSRARVSLDGPDLVAFALVSRILDEVEIQAFGVEPSVHGRGLGQALLQDVMEAERCAGARRVLLEVRESNRAARRLYGRCGFRAVGQRARYYRDGENALVLSVRL